MPTLVRLLSTLRQYVIYSYVANSRENQYSFRSGEMVVTYIVSANGEMKQTHWFLNQFLWFEGTGIWFTYDNYKIVPYGNFIQSIHWLNFY